MTTIRIGKDTFTILFPDLLRPLSDAERRGLKESIERREEVAVQVVVDEDFGVIDGGNRLTIAAEVGLDHVNYEMRTSLTLAEKRALALELNEHRRHLSADEQQALRQERIRKVAEDRQQGMSKRQIAAKHGVSLGQVQRDVKDAGKSGVSPDTPATVTGRDGKTYPASRPAQAPTPSEPEPAPPPSQPEAEPIPEPPPPTQASPKPAPRNETPEALKHLGKTPHQEAHEDAGRRWCEFLHDIYCLFNSIRDAGGLEELSAKWTVKHKQGGAQELRRICIGLEKFIKQLEGP